MAENNYSITIKNETRQAKSPIAGNNGSPIASKPSGGNTDTTDTGIDGVAALKKVVAVKGILVPVVDTVISNKISTVELRTSAAEQQERLSFAYSIGKQVGGIALSTAIGAATGNLPGALLGFTAGLINTAMSYRNRANELGLYRTVENVGLGYLNSRAGGTVATFSGSRLGRQ